MSGTQSGDDLQKTIADFSGAYQRWQRAATAHAALIRVQEGDAPPPELALTIKGIEGEPLRVSIEMGRLSVKEVSMILRPVVEFLYAEYKQSLLDTGNAAIEAHKLLQAEEGPKESTVWDTGSSPSDSMP